MGEWEAAIVEELVAAGVLEIGDGYRAQNVELSDEGLPFARAGNVDGRVDFVGADRLPVDAVTRVGRKRSRPGDVVFTSKGTVGRFALVTEDTEDFVFSPQLCFWRSLDPDRLDSRFVFFWFHGTECAEQLTILKGQTDMADYVSSVTSVR